MVCEVLLFILLSDVDCVGHLNVFCVWFYARLINTLEVGTLITFLQMWKLRYGEGYLRYLSLPRSFSCTLMELGY